MESSPLPHFPYWRRAHPVSSWTHLLASLFLSLYYSAQMCSHVALSPAVRAPLSARARDAQIPIAAAAETVLRHGAFAGLALWQTLAVHSENSGSSGSSGSSSAGARLSVDVGSFLPSVPASQRFILPLVPCVLCFAAVLYLLVLRPILRACVEEPAARPIAPLPRDACPAPAPATAALHFDRTYPYSHPFAVAAGVAAPAAASPHASNAGTVGAGAAGGVLASAPAGADALGQPNDAYQRTRLQWAMHAAGAAAAKNAAAAAAAEGAGTGATAIEAAAALSALPALPSGSELFYANAPTYTATSIVAAEGGGAGAAGGALGTEAEREERARVQTQHAAALAHVGDLAQVPAPAPDIVAGDSADAEAAAVPHGGVDPAVDAAAAEAFMRAYYGGDLTGPGGAGGGLMGDLPAHPASLSLLAGPGVGGGPAPRPPRALPPDALPPLGSLSAVLDTETAPAFLLSDFGPDPAASASASTDIAGTAGAARPRTAPSGEQTQAQQQQAQLQRPGSARAGSSSGFGSADQKEQSPFALYLAQSQVQWAAQAKAAAAAPPPAAALALVPTLPQTAVAPPAVTAATTRGISISRPHSQSHAQSQVHVQEPDALLLAPDCDLWPLATSEDVGAAARALRTANGNSNSGNTGALEQKRTEGWAAATADRKSVV